MEYYSAVKKKEILPFAATWMDLEGIMLSEISQPKKEILHDLTYVWNLKKNNKVTDTESRLLAATNCGVGEMGRYRTYFQL